VSLTTQKNIRADGDVVNGSKIENKTEVYVNAVTFSPKLAALQEALREEMEHTPVVRELIDELQKYTVRVRPADGVVGLRMKLEASGRSDEIDEAMSDKEAFVILLEKWSLYHSAQEILTYIMTKAIHDFRQFIRPLLANTGRVAQNELVTGRIIHPLVNEVGYGRFQMNAVQMMGMYYWLAEQCYVKWHA